MTNNSILLRAATAPDHNHEAWKKWHQDRVEESVKKAHEVLTGEKIENVRVHRLLSQAILSWWNESAFIQEYNTIVAQLELDWIEDPVELQNLAVSQYLMWAYESWDPIADIAETYEYFKKSVSLNFVPYVYAAVKETWKVPDSIIIAFMRHWNKLQHDADAPFDGEKATRKKWQLSQKGIEEAAEAWDLLKESSKITWIIWVQQPHNQMMMLHFLWGSASEARNRMPAEWQEPYNTWEVTTYEIYVHQDTVFALENTEKLQGYKDARKHIYNGIMVKVTRWWVSLDFPLESKIDRQN